MSLYIGSENLVLKANDSFLYIRSEMNTIEGDFIFDIITKSMKQKRTR